VNDEISIAFDDVVSATVTAVLTVAVSVALNAVVAGA
jgi:hypothetical protein